MSNVIKSVYFNVDAGEKCIIDSDSRVEQFIPEIYAQEKQIEEPFTFQPLSLGQIGEEVETEGYQDGLSVIHMDDVLEEERQKISQELSRETEQQIQERLDQANDQAEQIVTQAMDQAEEIRNQARIQGLEEGRQSGLVQAEQKCQEMEQSLQKEYQRKLQELEEQKRQMEPFFADLTAQLVEKITGVVCRGKKDVILHLIEGAVRNLEKPKQITLRVSKTDMAAVSLQKVQLKECAGEISAFDIVEDPNLKANQCIIETENKIVDCSLDVQLQSLRDQLIMLAR